MAGVILVVIVSLLTIGISAETIDLPSHITKIHVSTENVGYVAYVLSSDLSDWARDYVARGITMGLVPVALQRNYTSNITRAEFAALAVNLHELVTGREITGRIGFRDTTDVNVEKAAYSGIVLGVGNNLFAPHDTLTREQAAVMLSRLSTSIGRPLSHTGTIQFVDGGHISSWAIHAVAQVNSNAIMRGVGENRFAPHGAYTREQSIVTIIRLLDLIFRLPDNVGTDFINPLDDPDFLINSGQWSPYFRRQIVHGYYYNIWGARITEASYWDMVRARDRLLSHIIRPGMSDFEMVFTVHNWLAHNVSYNYNRFCHERWGGVNPNWIPTRYIFENTTAWSALILGTTTCGGFSDAFLYLLEPLGIQVRFVTGTAIFFCGRADEYHAWNMVQLGGSWFHVDVTWSQAWRELPNNMHQQVIVYDWFLISDSSIRNSALGATRYWNFSAFPAAHYDFRWNRPVLVLDQAQGRWRNIVPDHVVLQPEQVVTHSLTLSWNDAQAGTVSASQTANIVPSQQVTVHAQANRGFVFSHWEVHVGNIVLHDQLAPLTTFVMPDHNVSIRAVFTRSHSVVQAPWITICDFGILRWYCLGNAGQDTLVYGIYVDGVHQTGIGSNAYSQVYMFYDLRATMNARGFMDGTYYITVRVLSFFDLSPISGFSNTINFDFQSY